MAGWPNEMATYLSTDPYAGVYGDAEQQAGLQPGLLSAIAQQENVNPQHNNPLGLSTDRGVMNFTPDEAVQHIMRQASLMTNQSGPYARFAQTGDINDLAAVYSPVGAANDIHGTNSTEAAGIKAALNKRYISTDPSAGIAGQQQADIKTMLQGQSDAQRAMALATLPMNMPPAPEEYGKRADGTDKGQGFLGPLQRPDGKVSTELSIGVNMDGRETQIPTLIPTLTPEERQSLLTMKEGEMPSPEIIQKAKDFAARRISSGLSPFIEPGEQQYAQARNALATATLPLSMPPEQSQSPLDRAISARQAEFQGATEGARQLGDVAGGIVEAVDPSSQIRGYLSQQIERTPEQWRHALPLQSDSAVDTTIRNMFPESVRTRAEGLTQSLTGGAAGMITPGNLAMIGTLALTPEIPLSQIAGKLISIGFGTAGAIGTAQAIKEGINEPDPTKRFKDVGDAFLNGVMALGGLGHGLSGALPSLPEPEMPSFGGRAPDNSFANVGRASEGTLPTEAPTSAETQYGREAGVHDVFAGIQPEPTSQLPAPVVPPTTSDLTRAILERNAPLLVEAQRLKDLLPQAPGMAGRKIIQDRIDAINQEMASPVELPKAETAVAAPDLSSTRAEPVSAPAPKTRTTPAAVSEALPPSAEPAPETAPTQPEPVGVEQAIAKLNQTAGPKAVEQLRAKTEAQDVNEPLLSRIANRFTQERMASGELGEITPGEGTNTVEMIQKGLAMGPEKIAQHISDIVNKTGDPIAQASAVRAEEARLTLKAEDASRAARVNPHDSTLREAEAEAAQHLTDFTNGPVARLKQIFHRTGESLKGQIPVDMSTFNGQLKAWLDKEGAPPTLKDQARMRKIADVIAAQDKIIDAQSKPPGTEADLARIAEKERQAAVEEVKAGMRLKKNAGQGGFVNADMLRDAATVGAGHIRRGIANFADWSSRMVRDLGEWVRPHLANIWGQAKQLAKSILQQGQRLDEALAGRGMRLSRPEEAMIGGAGSNREPIGGMWTIISHKDGSASARKGPLGRDHKARIIKQDGQKLQFKIASYTETQGARLGNSAAYSDKIKVPSELITIDISANETPPHGQFTTFKGKEVKTTQAAKDASQSNAGGTGEVGTSIKLPSSAESGAVGGVGRRMTEEQRTEAKIKRTGKSTEQIRTASEAVKAGTYVKPEKRAPIQSNPVLEKALLEKRRALNEFNDLYSRAQFRARPLHEKALLHTSGVARAFAISGYHTLGKIFSFSVAKAIEHPLGAGVSAVGEHLPLIGPILKGASMEGGSHLKALGAYYAGAATKGMKAARDTIFRGSSESEAIHGRADTINENRRPSFWYDYVGGGVLHGAEKNIISTAAEEAYKARAYENAIKQGQDPNDPVVKGIINQKAWEWSQWDKLQEKNTFADKVNEAFHKMEAANPETGKAELDKLLLSTFIKTFVTKDIIRTPANYLVQNLAQHSPLGLARAVGKAAVGRYRGIENMTDLERNTIARLFKAGAIGTAMMVWGAYDASLPEEDRIFGGYYNPKKRSDKDVPFGTMRIGGHVLPHFMTHNLLTEPAQFGSTIYRVAHEKFKGHERGAVEGILTAALQPIENAPIASGVTRLSEAKNAGQSSKVVAGIVRNTVVPQLLQNIAEDTDSEDGRKPQNFLQGLEMGVPYLREQVPVKSSGSTALIRQQLGNP